MAQSGEYAMTMPFVYDKPEADKLANAKASGQASFDSIREMVEALNKAQDAFDNRPASRRDGPMGDLYGPIEDARTAIHEDPLSVEVRSGWEPADAQTFRASEYRILLSTGGPAVQIVGTLSEHGEPETAVMQVQDWFLPWTDYVPHVNGKPDRDASQETLLAYARCFYFGE
jgi:hypothetical protein